MTGYTYDTGMLIAAERNDRAAWVLHRQILKRHHSPTVPATVLAQAWRGGPQPMLSRLLTGCRIEPLDEPLARSAGTACARAQTNDAVDASVVASAATRGDTIVTSDDGDLQHLADAVGADLTLITT